jgi:hypothetical protein
VQCWTSSHPSLRPGQVVVIDKIVSGRLWVE